LGDLEAIITGDIKGLEAWQPPVEAARIYRIKTSLQEQTKQTSWFETQMARAKLNPSAGSLILEQYAENNRGVVAEIED
jgi:hypothetical protein